MKDLKHVPLLAVVLIIVLRISIGWQFLYEGMWKVQTLSTSDPWTSEGYLKNAQGPFREHFRSMTGDPDDLRWLDYAGMSQRWYDWRDRFISHYGLTEQQTAELNKLIDGSAAQDSAAEELPPPMLVAVALESLPAGVDPKSFPPSVRYNAEHKQLQGVLPVLPSEEQALLEMVDVALKPDGRSYGRKSNLEAQPDDKELSFYRGVVTVARNSRNLSFRHKLAAALRGDPELVGVSGERNPRGVFDIVMGTTTAHDESKDRDNIKYGKIQEYKDLVKDYNAALDQAALDYQYDHATMLGRKLAIERAAVVGPIRSLDQSLKTAALELLDSQQIKRGVLPPEATPLQKSDKQVILGLITLGLLLIVGFFTRGAAVLGAVMLVMFYLVMPPFPGVPPAPGPEHSLIVNKNLIEAFALLAIAALPTGSWFGIDGLIRNLWNRRRKVA
ncbi:DoxX family protein [Planctomicrobium sp. SH664]|uniref:DoxX family protein n=1 Tax=Planctomicrobium sp. SH664 TaxID=3448125 RepID=UPI003F5C5A15